MNYREIYTSKLTTPEKLAERLESGWSLGMDSGPSQTPAIMAAFARRAKAGGSHSNTLIQGIIYHNRRQVARGEGRSFKGELPAGGLGQRRAPRGGRLRGAEGVGIRGPPAVLPGA